MASAQPDGDPAPPDGSLPPEAVASVGERGLGFYVHVPFCSVRCGYCDFNTYTAAELGPADGPPGASRQSYAEAATAEVRLARTVLAGADRPVDTLFFGGGTPTLLPSADLVRILDAIRGAFGLADDVEVTTEANPDSVTPASLAELRAGGFNRISFGMQSSVSRVLRVLDRTHDPEGVPRAVQWAREAGFEQVSLDLIYGTPGETFEEWRSSLEAALACAPDHVSAYALIVEEGTALARQVARGSIAAPDDDDMADKYLLADELLTGAGLGWYELSNWARDVAARCRHNGLYWRGGDWWGVGPGAHSHVGGVRWWNVRHPTAWAARLASGASGAVPGSPAAARELLSAETRRVERILLETRLVEGLPTSVLDDAGRSWLPDLRREGLIGAGDAHVVLTRKGRLLADAVVRDLVP
jgi:putative oxygen-independent coproporphyrinogen III oxidase